MERKLLASVDSDNSKKDFKISKVLIDNWNYWMASEIITLFQTQKSVNVKAENIIQVLDFDRDFGFSSLLAELNNKKQELENSAPHQHPDIIRESIELYFYDIISFQIKELSQALLLELSSLLKTLIDVQFEQASPENLMIFFAELLQQLACKRGEWEEKKRFYLKREKSAWNSFDRLSELEDNNIWNAVEIAFESKLELEKSNCISFIVVELIMICQSYSNIVKRSFTLLEQIKRSLQDKNTLNITLSIPVFSLLQKINVDEQEKLLEVWMGGHKLNHWCNAPTTPQAIEQKLIDNIEPIIHSIFSEFEALFMDHL